MTDNERMHHKLKVQRITPKSEFLLELERKSANNISFIGKYRQIKNTQREVNCLYSQMIDCYTGSDLNHFRGSEWLYSESIPTVYTGSK